MLEQPSTAEIEAPLLGDTVHVLHRDYECRSQAILRTVGPQRYAADPTTEVLCCCYAVDDAPVLLWRPGDRVPIEFELAAQNASWVAAAFNDSFETAIEKSIMAPRYRWPEIPIERHRCVQAMALAVGLPGKLSTVAAALELYNRKDAGGERLMHQVSKPRRARKSEVLDRVHWFNDEDRLDRLYEYCAQDVATERELYGRLPPLSATEQAIWQLNHQINVRGFCVDRSLALAARTIAEAAAPEIDFEIAKITKGAVTSINQIAKDRKSVV